MKGSTHAKNLLLKKHYKPRNQGGAVMTVDFEALSQIPQMLELIVGLKATLEAGTIEKRWLSKDEVLAYIPFKIDSINTKVKKNEFIQDVHYYKKGRILIFDRLEIDNWIMNKKSANNDSYQGDDVSQFIDDFAV